MTVPARWLWHGCIPLAAGLVWLSAGFGFGPIGLLIALLPGMFLIAGGVSLVVWPGDLRIPQFVALAGILGVILGLPGLAVYTVGTGVVLVILSAASFLASGFSVMRQADPPESVPTPRHGIATAAKIALDDALLGYFTNTAKIPQGETARELSGEIRHWLGTIREQGWDKTPESFHQTPPPLENPRLEQRSHSGRAYEKLSFESGYQPHSNQPGVRRWNTYASNRVASAHVLRHPGEPRPWLVCIHGYRMGAPYMDFSLFNIKWLHDELGLNLLLPTLPLHGPRKYGFRSGDGFLEGNVADMINAEAQSVWDIRRMLDWLRRAEQAPAIGVLGYSLGGYNTALLGALEPDLACLIAGIPAVDLPGLLWRHMPPEPAEYLRAQGLGLAEAQAAMRVVSPTSMPCKVPRERRFIFAGIVDRLVIPSQVVQLAEHWENPRLVWYEGAHLTFMGQRSVTEVIREGLDAGGLLGR